jgi:hypothetical protein
VSNPSARTATTTTLFGSAWLVCWMFQVADTHAEFGWVVLAAGTALLTAGRLRTASPGVAMGCPSRLSTYHRGLRRTRGHFDLVDASVLGTRGSRYVPLRLPGRFSNGHQRQVLTGTGLWVTASILLVEAVGVLGILASGLGIIWWMTEEWKAGSDLSSRRIALAAVAIAGAALALTGWLTHQTRTGNGVSFVVAVDDRSAKIPRDRLPERTRELAVDLSHAGYDLTAYQGGIRVTGIRDTIGANGSLTVLTDQRRNHDAGQTFVTMLLSDSSRSFDYGRRIQTELTRWILQHPPQAGRHCAVETTGPAVIAYCDTLPPAAVINTRT